MSTTSPSDRRSTPGHAAAWACLVVSIALLPALAAAAGTKATSRTALQNRCGWFVNPTPANAWLDDRDGSWTVALQGGHQADGDWPEFADKDWVVTNGSSYGHGCACMKVKVDRKSMTVLRIASAQSKPLAQCRRDPKLKEPKD
ncbi:DUF4087 domain-containing protein [Lysobacter sp. CA196]|uniref:DUF4087 domain-containing protein n=1 Tax=Lysobacter sp. CA196 TaxID=3455606 RepID=UPI003F8D1D2F